MLPNASDIQIVNSQIRSFVERDARPNVGIGSENLNAMNTALIDNIVVWARNTGISFGGPSLILNNSLINVGNILSSSTLSGIRTTQSNNSIIHLQDVQINMYSNSSSRLIGLQPSFPGSKILAKNIVIDLLAEASNAYAFATVVGNESTSLTLNESLILLNSPMGFAYIVGGNSLSSGFIEINQGVLDMNARTTGIKMPGSGSKVYIDDLSSCFYNGAAGLC